MKRCITTIIISFMTVLGLAQSKYHVQAEGFGNYDLKGKTFFIAPADENIKMNDLEFQEYAACVTTLLEYEGAIKAKDLTTADMCILFYYNITDHQVTLSIPVPIRGVIGSTSSTYTNTNTYGSIYGNVYGSVYDNSAYVSADAYGSANTNQNTTTSSTTYSTPIYGTVGYSSSSQTVTEYIRMLGLYAYDNNITEEPIMLWKANIQSEGSSNRLSEVLPMMCFAATGEGLGKKMTFEFNVYDDDERAKYLIHAMDNRETVTVKRIPVAEGIMLRYIERTEDGITLVYTLKKGATMRISPFVHIEADGVDYPLSSVNEGRIKKKVKNSGDKIKFVKLHFSGVPNNAQVISIQNGECLNMENEEIK